MGTVYISNYGTHEPKDLIAQIYPDSYLYGDDQIISEYDTLILPQGPERLHPDYLAFIKSIGFALPEILYIDNNDNPADALLADRRLFDVLRDRVRSGWTFDAWRSESGFDQLMNDLDVPLNQVLISPVRVAEQFDNKVNLRKTAQQIFSTVIPDSDRGSSAVQSILDSRLRGNDGEEYGLTAGRVCRSIEDVRSALSDYKKIIVKLPESDGGIGHRIFTQEQTIDLDGHYFSPDCIAERCIDFIDAPSVQYHLTKEWITFVGSTTQLFYNNTNWLGSFIPYPKPLDRIEELVMPFVRYAQSIGYKGYMGIDLLETADGHLYISEINGRKTQNTTAFYALKKFGFTCALVKDIYLNRPLTYPELNGFLEASGVLFDRNRGGLIPLLVRSANHPTVPVFYALILGPTKEKVIAYQEKMNEELRDVLKIQS